MTENQNEVHYRHETVKVLRGREASTIRAKESQGWELVRQTPGTLRTELAFRKEIQPTFFKPWMGIAGLFAFGIIALGGVAITEALGGDDEEPRRASDTTSQKDSEHEGSDSSATATEQPSSTPEATPEESETTDTEPSPSAAPTPETPAGPLTIETNQDLKRMLTADDDYSLNQAFAKKYDGQEIEFDGSVSVAGGGNTLVYAGDNSDTDYVPGPAFQFRGTRVPVDPGEPARFVAIVESFNADHGLFYLGFVSATPR